MAMKIPVETGKSEEFLSREDFFRHGGAKNFFDHVNYKIALLRRINKYPKKLSFFENFMLSLKTEATEEEKVFVALKHKIIL